MIGIMAAPQAPQAPQALAQMHWRGGAKPAPILGESYIIGRWAYLDAQAVATQW